MCIDSTSVIWCMRGNPAPTSQWAFIKVQEAMALDNITIRWSPGHCGIEGNELADKLADEAAAEDLAPTGAAAEPTVSGLKSDVRRLNRLAELDWWTPRALLLNSWYRSWLLDYNPRKAPKELSLSRPSLAKIIAMRTRHGHFAWYHRKFKHEDAVLHCRCGALLAPGHVVYCPHTTRRFCYWPQRPARPPRSAEEGIKYLRTLQPLELQWLLELYVM